MLEELNILAKRIKSLVGRVQTLTAQSGALTQELLVMTRERDELAKLLDAERTQKTELAQSLGSVQTSASRDKAKAQEDHAALQGTLDLFKQENEAMQTSLKSREQEVQKLREVNQQARQRIDGVLEKLPGAVSQEAN
jgi:chromosome segregation ATPase